jgi:hypothetical protein
VGAADDVCQPRSLRRAACGPDVRAHTPASVGRSGRPGAFAEASERRPQRASRWRRRGDRIRVGGGAWLLARLAGGVSSHRSACGCGWALVIVWAPWSSCPTPGWMPGVERRGHRPRCGALVVDLTGVNAAAAVEQRRRDRSVDVDELMRRQLGLAERCRASLQPHLRAARRRAPRAGLGGRRHHGARRRWTSLSHFEFPTPHHGYRDLIRENQCPSRWFQCEWNSPLPHSRLSRLGSVAPSCSPTRTRTRLPTTTLALARSRAERSRRAPGRWPTHCGAWRAATARLRSRWPRLPNRPAAGAALRRGRDLCPRPRWPREPRWRPRCRGSARVSAGHVASSVRPAAARALVTIRKRAGLASGPKPAGECGHGSCACSTPGGYGNGRSLWGVSSRADVGSRRPASRRRCAGIQTVVADPSST